MPIVHKIAILASKPMMRSITPSVITDPPRVVGYERGIPSNVSFEAFRGRSVALSGPISDDPSIVGGLFDGHNDDGGIVLEWLTPAVGDGLLDGHRGRCGGGALGAFERPLEAVDAKQSAVLGSPFYDSVG